MENLYKDKRDKVFEAINSEREFQDNAMKSGGTHIVKEFPLGSALSAIQHKLDVAREKWYGDVTPHQDTMVELRKIAAICVQMGEQYDMPERVNHVGVIPSKSILINQYTIEKAYIKVQEKIAFKMINKELRFKIIILYQELLPLAEIICDETNNFPETIDRGEINVEVRYNYQQNGTFSFVNLIHK